MMSTTWKIGRFCVLKLTVHTQEHLQNPSFVLYWFFAKCESGPGESRGRMTKLARPITRFGLSTVEASKSNGTYKVVYLCSYAGNYKFWGEFCIAGPISMDDLKLHLLHGEYFVPERMGIPSLIPDARNDDDHPLHEIDSIVPARPSVCAFTAADFICRIRAASETGWFRCP